MPINREDLSIIREQLHREPDDGDVFIVMSHDRRIPVISSCGWSVKELQHIIEQKQELRVSVPAMPSFRIFSFRKRRTVSVCPNGTKYCPVSIRRKVP